MYDYPDMRYIKPAPLSSLVIKYLLDVHTALIIETIDEANKK